MKSAVAAIAVALALPAAAQGTSPAPSAVQASCSAPEGWAEVLAREPKFVVFGELHGTEEGPEFIANLLCAEASRGQRLLLAVEHSSWQNTDWQNAWVLPHREFKAALPDLGWAGRNDGVASQAMLKLVLAAHALKEQGAMIGIVAFNGARDQAQNARFADLPSQGPHEAAQAENIAEATALQEYDRVIVLVGNLHAEIAPLDIGEETFDPMAKRLAGYGKVISLDMKHAGGTSWSCQLAPGVKPAPGENVTDDMIKCASYKQRAAVDLDRPSYIDISQSAAEALGGRYHGLFWVGPITASPPAFAVEERQ